MALFKKYDWWSIQEQLDNIMEYDYNGNEKDSIYWDHYSDQIQELSIIAGDMYSEMETIKRQLWDMPYKKTTFYEEDECSQTSIAWFNTAACMFSDIDMVALLDNEERYDWEDQEEERLKRIRALESLTKKQFMKLNTIVIGFISRYLELCAAFDVIKSCISELDYHQAAVKGEEAAMVPLSAYL